jgi:hypothetical protein
MDANGNKLKKAQSPEEKNATSMLHRLVWNLKRVINLAPGGSTRIGSLTAAYLLVRESYEEGISEEDSERYFTENFDRFWNLPFEEREIVEDAFSTLLNLEEDAPANASGAAVSTDQPAIKRTRKFAEFQVDDDTFSKFKNGKAKFRRWNQYLNLEDSSHRDIYDFARKNHRGIIVLKDSTGQMKGIRYSRKGSGNWASLKRKPKELAEAVVFNQIEVGEFNA